ncbi:MAG: signal peptidase I [Clostridia bacterium]|nr:signal peptidase I [Clostridia bacterium]
MLYDWADALVYALIVIVLLFTLAFRMTGVVGGSMQPTLYEGDKLIISNLFYEPEPGDIVVVTKQSFRSEPIVKRVIAVAGQTVNIDQTTGEVYIDGVLQKEDYVNEVVTYEFGDMEFPVYVEEGHIFVMGDNRNHSTDSRMTEVGLIDTRMVLGKVLFRVFPVTSFGSVYR